MGSPPRAPAYANPEVASYYVQYNRGPLRAWFFFFSAVFLVLALFSVLSWSDLASAVLFTAIGLALFVLGFAGFS